MQTENERSEYRISSFPVHTFSCAGCYCIYEFIISKFKRISVKTKEYATAEDKANSGSQQFDGMNLLKTCSILIYLRFVRHWCSHWCMNAAVYAFIHFHMRNINGIVSMKETFQRQFAVTRGEEKKKKLIRFG